MKTKTSVVTPKDCHTDISETQSNLMWHRQPKINLVKITQGLALVFNTRQQEPFWSGQSHGRKRSKLRGEERRAFGRRQFHKS